MRLTVVADTGAVISLVLSGLFGVIAELKHYVEDRRWIEPFWDDEREVEVNGTKIKLRGLAGV